MEFCSSTLWALTITLSELSQHKCSHILRRLCFRLLIKLFFIFVCQRFVQGVLSFYYKNDLEVEQDSELQKWIRDIYEHGFLSPKDTGELNAAVSHTICDFLFSLNKECAFCPILTGIPQSFTTVAEMVKFVTMAMFTCSAQHSAVNGGQVTFYKPFGNGSTVMLRKLPLFRKSLLPQRYNYTTQPVTMLKHFAFS